MARIHKYNRYIAAAYLNGERYLSSFVQTTFCGGTKNVAKQLANELNDYCSIPVSEFEIRITDRLTGETTSI